LYEEEVEFISLTKQIQNLKQDKSSFMDNENHKNTWNNFTKFVTWGTIVVILVLILMAIFLV
jgi:cell division protein FtsX